MEHIIELWQQATIDESRTDRIFQTEDLVPMIINLEHKQQRLIRFKTLSSIILSLALLILFLNRTSITLYSGLGIGIFISSLMVVVVLLNRLRFHITYEERSLSTIKLAGLTERKINMERKLFTLYLPLFVIVALTGFNLMYLDLFIDEEVGTRILYHLVMSGSVLIGFVVGLTVRIKRFHKQFLPVLERIKKFKDEAE